MKNILSMGLLLAAVVATPNLSKGAIVYGGDAANQASADSVLDIVFASDTSGSMGDEISAISTNIVNALANMNCPKGDIWVRARLMGITGTSSGTQFDETVKNYVQAVSGTPLSDHSEDNGPAVVDLVNYYDWNDDTTAAQKYFKAVVTVGDEGTENGWGVDAADWAIAQTANASAIANDVFLFAWQGSPYYADSGPVIKNLYEKMAEGGTQDYAGVTYTFGATGGSYTDLASVSDFQAELERLFCVAGSGGNVVPEPTTLAIWSVLGALGMISGWRRRRRAA